MTRKISEAHITENLAEVLKQAIDDWKLTGKVYGFSTDNCKNIANAVVEHLEVFHLPRIGHNLQLRKHST